MWSDGDTYEESSVEGFTALAFDGVVCCSTFCGVCTSAGFAFDLGGVCCLLELVISGCFWRYRGVVV